MRRSLERWIEKRQGGVSWKEGCPAGVRPYLQVAERLPVEVSELPTAVGRQIEAVELKLTIFCAACTEEFERRLTTENPLAHIAENEAGIQRVVRLGEHAVAAIRLAEKTCTEQWDAWQVPFYKRPISLRAEVSNYQGPRRLPGYDND
ncbi:MAG: hypothetical protein KF689_08655 [Gemmatimonadaceae bacterium]|nr:hypothetical protein [Gemmatimonadaceae bacterium]MCW5826335.1 hypothetical protein [Gemmatimonadaceae bacterium]